MSTQSCIFRNTALAAVLSAFVAATALGAAAPSPDDVDLKPLALEVYGVRGALAKDSNTVVVVLGAACAGPVADPKAWRVVCDDDPNYRYEDFVAPVAARRCAVETEFSPVKGFGAPGPAKQTLTRKVVELKLPSPLQPGLEYGLVAIGHGGSPVSAAKTGCFFTWDGKPVATPSGEIRVPADALAPCVVGLRRVSPLGDGKVALEFGASLSDAGCKVLANYDIRVNGERTSRPPEVFGRRSKIDFYLTEGWPFKVFLLHDIYLDIGKELCKGDRVEITVGEEVCAGERSASFVFDPDRTVTRSIQANQVGYLPDGPKVAYLGFWLGSYPEAAKAPAAKGAADGAASSFDEIFAQPEPPPPADETAASPDGGTGAGAPDASPAPRPLDATGYDDLAPYALRFREPPAFELVREGDGKAVFSGRALLVHNGLENDGRVNHSAENVYVLDFTPFAEPGRYYLRVDGVGRSIAFDVSPDAYLKPFRTQAAGVFAQRCGFELTRDHAPGWRRIACHAKGVIPTTVRNTGGEFGKFRENMETVPNPAFPAAEARRKALEDDPALLARFPLDGSAENALAGSSLALAPLGGGSQWVADAKGKFAGKVLRTGESDNGFACPFAFDPDKGATAAFWMRRNDSSGNKYGGTVAAFGDGKDRGLAVTAGWGVLSMGGKGWQRVGDDVWRHYVAVVSPTNAAGRVEASFYVDGAPVAVSGGKAPSADSAFILARIDGDSAAGSHFRDLRLYTRALSPGEAADLGREVPAEIPRVIPLRGGHHDAGDYNPRCHIDVAQTLLAAWEFAPGKFRDGQLDIPEAGNGIPDIVDEALWALEPWKALQTEDGGVYAGTESDGDPGFADTVELDPKGDFAWARDCRASFVFAGTFAQASRVLAACGRGDLAADFLSRARRAYAWAVANPATGLKDSAQAADFLYTSRAYAAAELLHTTGEKAFLDDFRKTTPWSQNPSAVLVNYGKYDASLAAYAFVRNPSAETLDPPLLASVKGAILREADFYLTGSDKMAYKFVRHPDAPISWGTGAYGVHIRPVLAAWRLTGDSRYRDWVIRTCDGTLGANPLGLCWVTGLGERAIRCPLHNSRYRPEGVPVAGMQAEGPYGRGGGYNYESTVYPPLRRDFAVMHTFVDCHFAIAMDEGLVRNQALSMALFGLLLP